MVSGRPIAVAFARIVLTERLPLDLARIAAFFFMYQAKESGYGTGGDTQVCYLPRVKSIGQWDDKVIAEQVEKMMRLSLLDASQLRYFGWKDSTKNLRMPLQEITAH